MKIACTEFWAKRCPRDAPTDWHSLADHSHDVAAVFEALLALPVFEARLAALTGRSSLSPLWRARLTVLTFLHDFGKANWKFQLGEGGHIHEATPVVMDEGWREATGLERLLDWADPPDGALQFFTSILAHHGYPADFTNLDVKRRFWRGGRPLDPLAAVAALVSEAEMRWPAAFVPGGEPLPQQSTFWHGFLGLLQLADWLGSDDGRDAFPYSRDGDGPRRGFAVSRAAKLLAATGLDVTALRRDQPAPDFSAVSEHAPRPIQTAVGEAPGPIVVMEAETGSGKTEAALYRFARLFAAGRVDGFYLALPTRVAASQMFRRVRDSVERLFPDPANRPPVVQALPGDAGVDEAGVLPRGEGREQRDAGARALPPFSVEWSDDPNEAERRKRWAAERPKRFLAAAIAVGTIDQALLGAVRVKHAQMRSMCLARALLVVDEVHASDAYMSGLLANLLDQHLRAGGEALLLSATLGAQARTSLMLAGSPLSRPKRRALAPAPETAAALPYPAISTLRDGAVVTEACASGGAEKTVRIEPSLAIGQPEAVAQEALAAARAGARVLVIRNTVGDAVATRIALEALAPGDPVQFTLNGVPTLHHGRFAREDRRRLDAEVERRLGKTAPRERGLVVVGTQTLEISLDIDADLLVTDLAPADVLLQRIGRLHRHERERPAGFERATCVVLMPDNFDAALATVKRERMNGPHGLGSIYPDLLALEATRRLIGAGAGWTIPAMNRALVESATHSQRLDALAAELALGDPRWSEAKTRLDGGSVAMRNTAEAARLKWDAPIEEFTLDEHAATRLGARNVELRFDPLLPGPFGEAVSRLVVPHHLNPSGAFEPVDIARAGLGFAFKLQGSPYVYDEWGLRRTQPD
jgi:CRISPR-associated endonuclease/helicase Cas3